MNTDSRALDARERYLRVAVDLSDRRVVSKQKAKVIDLTALSECIRTVADTQDEENRGSAKPGLHLLECSVCHLWKKRFYFKKEQQEQQPDVRVCRYCTWRIRTEVDRKYRELRGLGPRPNPREPVFPDHSAEVEAFVKARRSSPKPNGHGGTTPEPDELNVGGFYGPSFANLVSGWCSQTSDEDYAPDRDTMLSWWDHDCDLIVEWFLHKYGMFTRAFADEIRGQIALHLHPNAKWARNHDYFLMARILQEKHLWVILARDLSKRGREEHRCGTCGTAQAYTDIHPDRIKWSDGVVLPLCNDCWKILERCLYPEVPHGETVADFAEHIESVLSERTCPVCNKKHSWRGHSYSYTEGFYSIPGRYREICFSCLDEAINRNMRDRRIRRNRDALLQISKLIDGLPSKDMSKVVFEQAESLDVAVGVVKIMKTMWKFDRLASITVGLGSRHL